MIGNFFLNFFDPSSTGLNPSGVNALDFFFIPGGIKNKKNNVYNLTDFSIMADAISALSPKRIRLFVIDETTGSAPIIQIPVKTGMNWKNVKVIGVNTGPGRTKPGKPTLNFADGCTWAKNSFCLDWNEIDATFNNTSVSNVEYDDQGLFLWKQHNATLQQLSDTEDYKILEYTSIDADWNFILSGDSKLLNFPGDDFPCIDMQNDDINITIDLYDSAELGKEIFISTLGGAPNYIVNRHSSASVFDVQGSITNPLANNLFLREVNAATMTGDTNLFNPPGMFSARVVRIPPGGSNRIINGILEMPIDRRVTLINLENFTLTLGHLNGAASAIRQIICPGAVDFVISGFGSVDIYYDDITKKWRVISK